MRALLFVLLLAGCESPKHATTTLEILQVEPTKDAAGATTRLSLEMRYAECPGDARRIVQADKAYAACAGSLKAGDKLKADMISTWQSERGSYRTDIVKLGSCALKLDPKDEANYEMVQSCTDVVATGTVVGVRCDRTRSKELVAKCPWLKRR